MASVVGVFQYVFFIALLAVIALLCCVLSKKMSARARTAFFGALLVASAVMHFLRVLVPPLSLETGAARWDLFAPSLCVANRLLFPLFFFSRIKVLRDYMYYAGVTGGVAAVLFPVGVSGGFNDYFVWEYYIYHVVEVAVPLAMVVSGMHKLDYRRIIFFPLVLTGVLAFVMLNNVLEVKLGIISQQGDTLGTAYRNLSLVWGPTYGPAADVINALTPRFMRTIPFGRRKGEASYIPLLYMLPTIVLFGLAAPFVLSLPFQGKRIFCDCRTWCTKRCKKQKTG